MLITLFKEKVTSMERQHRILCTVEYTLGLRKGDRNGEMTLIVISEVTFHCI